MSTPNFTSFITSHFRYAEFMSQYTFEQLVETDGWQRVDWLIYRLCKDHLEPIRAIVEQPLRLTDGVRTWQRHLQLSEDGYNPSLTSDHSFGLSWNWLGVGAADFVPVEDGRWSKELFDHVAGVRVRASEDPPWGQFIYYPERGHCHIANRRDVLYSAQAQAGLPFRKYRSRTYEKE